MSLVQIRRATTADLAELCSLYEKTIRTTFPGVYSERIVQFFLAYHNREKVKQYLQNSLMCVAQLKDKIVAAGYLRGSEIGGVYVLPQYQNSGVGRELVYFLEIDAIKKGMKQLWLDATPFAKNFYLKLGYQLLYPAIQLIDQSPLPYFKMVKTLS